MNFDNDFISHSEKETEEFASQLARHVAPGAVNGNFQVNSCLLLPNRSSTDIHQAQFNVFFDTNGTPDPTISVPGCPPNNIGILNLPTSSKLNQNVNVQMICQDILTRAEVTRTASINPSALSYEECPASS